MEKRQDNILVLLRVCRDPKVPASPGRSGYGVRTRGERYLMNPADRTALEFALDAGKSMGMQVTAVGLGNETDTLMPEALAMAADRAIVLEGFSGNDDGSMDEASRLCQLVRLLDPYLVCTGTRLLDRGAAPAPAVAAARLGYCAVHSVLSAVIGSTSVEIFRKGDRGSRQRVVAPLPCFLLFEEAKRQYYPEIDQLLNGLDQTIERWSPSTLGLGLHTAASSVGYTRRGKTVPPRPRPVAVTTPDPELPAFERILTLLEGGIRTRQGKVQQLKAEETAERLLEVIRASASPEESR